MISPGILLENINKIHTTDLGVERLRKNLQLQVDDVIVWCKDEVLKKNALIEKKGKNWYVNVDGCQIVINGSSYTVITAHKLK